MPRIPREWLNAVVYFYASEADANKGSDSGGTGFIVSVNAEEEKLRDLRWVHSYLVTNDHVRCTAGALRINLKASEFDVIPVAPEEWKCLPEMDDIAIRPLGFDPNHRRASVNEEMVLSGDRQRTWDFGPGDEVFFIGRYTKLDGKESNIPTVRSGIVSAMPADPVYQDERDHRQETILVEARSMSGYSGSPVFIHRSARIERGPEIDGAPKVPIVRPEERNPCFLLGIDWGHHPWTHPVINKKTGKQEPDLQVQGNSGMMMVVPADKLMSLLYQPEMIMQRRETEKNELKRLATPSSVLDSEPSGGEFEKFENLTGKLLKVPKKELDEKRREEDDPSDPSQ